MELVRTKENDAILSGLSPENDKRTDAVTGSHGTRVPWRKSEFPEGAIARIYRPSRSATTSGRARTKGWRLAFERRSPSFIEPLMGYTGSADTLTQVELCFPTLESAIRYAERQGLVYFVQGDPRPAEVLVEQSRGAQVKRVFAGMVPRRPQPRWPRQNQADRKSVHLRAALDDPGASYADREEIEPFLLPGETSRRRGDDANRPRQTRFRGRGRDLPATAQALASRAYR